MATIYLRSTDGSDADNGSTWALAKATLNAALTAAGTGGTVYVSQSHAESTASAVTIASPSTTSNSVRVICVNDAAEPPTAVATTATFSTTGNNGINFTGLACYFGIAFTAGNSTGTASFNIGNGGNVFCRFDACTLAIGSTGTGGRITVGGGGTNISGLVEFINCNVIFANASQAINAKCQVNFVGGAIAATGTVPTLLFAASQATKITTVLRGVDLSAFGSGTSLASLTNPDGGMYSLRDCKLGASVSLTNGTPSRPGYTELTAVNCDSGDTNYRYYYQSFGGTVTHEATVVRTGGASDGTTSISRNMTSSANTKFYIPLELGPLVIWNESTSSLTVTVHIVTDNVTLTDAECWIEVEELGTSGYPLSVTQSDRAAGILATAANQTTSTEAWTTTGLGTPVYQKLNVTFTPAEKGPIKVRVMLAKASTTVYVCPKIEVS